VGRQEVACVCNNDNGEKMAVRAAAWGESKKVEREGRCKKPLFGEVPDCGTENAVVD
jgi:hypothetical protein